jgi:DNA-binding transcriptional MerR regulator
MTDELLTISAFARQVGLTPSALRFYDDCGLLRPASVDEQNGYRYYSPSQEARAALLRDLREIDLPLAEVRVVLDEDASHGVAVIQSHLKTVEGKAEAARRATARILASLQAVPYASAVRQVAAAAAATDEIPALACVLLELGEDEVTLVATDRYRLSVRKLQPLGFAGYPRNLLVRASELTALARWVGAAAEVRLETGPAGTALVVDGESRPLGVVDDEFPAYQSILDGLTPPTCRVVADRQQLLALLTGETVALDIDSGRVTVTAVDSGEPLGVLEGIGSGAVQLGFSASLLAAALSVSVGPDVLLELCAVDRPVVVRSADQGTFTTLVMPTRLDG